MPKELPKKEVLDGSTVFRVFSESLDDDGNRKYEANQFNPYFAVTLKSGSLLTEQGKCAHFKKKTHRFSPTVDGKRLVPAIYIGTTENVALSETIFRSHDKKKPITLSDLDGKYLSELSFNQKVVLCDLSSPLLKGGALAQFDFTSEESIDSKQSTKAYKRCHEIANAIYQHKDKVDGLIWESRHLPNTYNIVLWQRESDFEPLDNYPLVREELLLTGKGKQTVLLEACRLEIPASELMHN